MAHAYTLPPEFHLYQMYENCYKNDLFWDKTKPFDQDFETTATGTKKYVPEKDRKPLIQVPVGRQITETVVSYTFGEDNFPRVLVKTENQVFGPEYDIETTNLMMQNLITSLIKKSFLRTTMLSVARHAVSQGKTILVTKIVNSKVRYEVINMKWVRDLKMTDADDEVIESFREVKLIRKCDEQGVECDYWACREFNPMAEIVYEPVKCDSNEPIFDIVSPRSPEPHMLGYCPAILVCHSDGASIFENQVENIKEYSYFESHILSGFKKNMNPQRVWLGENPDVVQNLIRSSDSVWLMPPGDFKSDAPNPQAYQYAMNQEERLRELILRGCRVVEIPNSNYQSGDALKMKLAPELNLINEVREAMGDKALVEILYMTLKMVVEKGQPIETEDAIIQPSIDVGYGIMLPHTVDCEISLAWGEIFMSTAQSRNLDVQTAVMAANPENSEEPLLSQYSVRQAISRHFHVDDMIHEQMQINKEGARRLSIKVVNSVLKVAEDTANLALLSGILEALEESEDNAVDFIVEYLRKTVPEEELLSAAAVDDAIEEQEGLPDDEATEKEDNEAEKPMEDE